jgi:hypothetical protein
MVPRVTLLEVMRAVAESAATELEWAAAVVHLVNSHQVELVGPFRGFTFTVERSRTRG